MPKRIPVRQSHIFENVVTGATIDRENSIIRNMSLLSEHSLNKRTYPVPTMDAAVPLFEGAKAYINHAEPGTSRTIQELLGQYSNVHLENNIMYGDLTLVDFQEKVFSIAEKTPNLIGNSVDIAAFTEAKEDTEEVTEIVKVYSIDLVTEPATTKGLFESKENKKEEEGMKLSEATIADLRTARPDLVSQIVQEGKDSRNEEVATLTKERDNLKESLSKKELSEAEAKKKETIDSLLKESELTEKAITDTFKQTLYSLTEKTVDGNTVTIKEQAQKLIEDRVAVAGGVKGIYERKPGGAKGEEKDEDVELEEVFMSDKSQGFHALKENKEGE